MKPVNTNYKYRQIGKSDAELLKNLLKAFGEAFEDINTYQGAVPTDKYLEALLAKPHFITIVALCEGEVMGGLAAYELEKFEQERKEIYIYDLAVSEKHRREGVAKNLVQELKRIAKERGVYVIFVQADRGDAAAIRLYESLGKREDVHQFDISVD